MGNFLTFIKEFIGIITFVWYLFSLVIIIYIYIRYDKEHKLNFKDNTYKYIPNEYGPEVLSSLLTSKVMPISFGASILYLIKKDMLTLTNEKGTFIINNNLSYSNETPKEDDFLRDFIINKIGNGEKVTTRLIKNMVKSYKTGPYFVNVFKKWIEASYFEISRYKFYHKIKKNLKIILFSIIGVIIWIANLALNGLDFTSTGVGSIATFLIIVMAIYIVYYLYFATKRTEDANESYYKWLALRNYLKTFSIKNKDIDKSLIDSYFVYSIILGLSGKMKRDIIYNEKAYQEIEHTLKIKPKFFLEIVDLNNAIIKGVNKNNGKANVGGIVTREVRKIEKTNDTTGDRGIGF